jgi:hypothetical protein
MSTDKLLTNAIAQRTIETRAAFTTKSLNSSTESRVTRENYERYQSHYTVSFTET